MTKCDFCNQRESHGKTTDNRPMCKKCGDILLETEKNIDASPITDKAVEKIADEIKQTIHALLEYEGYQDKRSQEYGDGWNEALHQVGTELLGVKSKDNVKVLKKEAGIEQ